MIKRLKTGTVILACMMAFFGCGGGGGGTSGPGNGNSGQPGQHSGTDSQATVPQGLVATATTRGRIDLSWSASEKASSYNVYRINTSAAIASVTGTKLADSGLGASTNYCYQISAVDSNKNESAKSEQVCATTIAGSGSVILAPPSGFTVVPISRSRIDLTWTPMTNVSAYKIYRADTGWLKNVFSASATSDIGLSPLTQYCYQISIFDPYGAESEKSEQKCVSTTNEAVVLSKPTVTATVISENRIDLIWNVVSGASEYKLYRKDKQGVLQSITASAATDSGLTENTNYCYQVLAVDDEKHESAKSDEVCKTTFSAKMKPTALIAVAASPYEIDLQWRAPEITDGLKGFQIFREDKSSPLNNGLLSVATLTYSDKGLLPSTKYVYTVKAVYPDITMTSDTASAITNEKVAVSAGTLHSLATRANNIYAWGQNANGQLGYGETSDISEVPTKVSGTNLFIKISAGESHNLAIDPYGFLWGWGSNEFGKLGGAIVLSRIATTPVQVTNTSGVAFKAVAVAAGTTHSLALQADGTVLFWGDNQQGQFGAYTAGNWDVTRNPLMISGLSNITAIATSPGAKHSLALDKDKNVWAWGKNDFGQLGLGAAVTSVTLTQVPGLPKITAIATGNQHSLALDENGNVWGWGHNDGGQIIPNNSSTVLIPTQVNGLPKIKAIAAGYKYSIALAEDGTVWGWGSNNYNVLGFNDMYAKSQGPLQITGLPSITTIAAGVYHNLAITGAGEVWGWGTHVNKQIGPAYPDISSDWGQPRKISGL